MWLWQSSEIAELRQECVDLRHANANLERQVKEGLQVNLLRCCLAGRTLTPHCSRTDTAMAPGLVQDSALLYQEARSSAQELPSLHRTQSPWLYPPQDMYRLLLGITTLVDTLSKPATFLASTSLSLREVQVLAFGHFHEKDTLNFYSILLSRAGRSSRPHGIVYFRSLRPRERQS